MRRVVTHVTLAFQPLSEAWMYDLITAPISYEARVLTLSRDNKEQFPYENVETLRLPTTRRWSRSRIHDGLRRRFGRPRTPANTWKRSLRRAAGTPTLFHAHYGPVGWRVVDAGLSPTVTSFYGFDASESATLAEWHTAYRWLFRRGAAFIAEGPAMHDRLIGLGAPGDRTHVVPLIASLGEEWEPAACADGEPLRVLMAGRLVEKKGFADGVAAFAEARRAGIDARLLILGSGPEESRLKDGVRTQGVEDDVDFLPAVPRERFRELIRSCPVFLQPSRTAPDGDAEGGAPTTLLEAQALGRVVVATDHADIPHVVDPDAAFISPEGDVDALAGSLTRALTATSEWAARGAAGRRFVERYHSLAHASTCLERVYDEVADA